MGDEVTGTELEQPKLNPITRKPWTDEERRAQSERAKAQVAAGQIGGARHGRRKKPPAYAVIAAQAQKNGSMIAKTLIAIIEDEENPSTIRMNAIKLITDIELKAKQNRREEEDHLNKLPHDELQRLALEQLARFTGEDYDIDLGDDAVEEDGGEYVGDEAEEALT